MTNPITALKALLLRILTPSVSTLIAQTNRVEAIIQKAIDKEHDVLAGLHNSRIEIEKALKVKNGQIDAAYKLLNTVGGLTK